MKAKKLLIGLGIAATLLLFYGVYKFSTFSIFDNEFEMIENFRVPNRNYSLRIYFIPSNASSQSYIQVRKFESNIEEVLQSYERFNYLNNYEILGKDTLKLSISDTSKVNLSKEVKLKLP